METVTNLFIVGFVIVAGLIAQYIFRKTRAPDVMFLMVLGAILSQFGFTEGLKQNPSQITFLITFSLIYVVFYGALPIRIKAIFSTMKYAFLSSIINFVVTTTILGLFSRLLGFDWIMAFSLGALFCVLDGSIINSLIDTIGLGKRAEAQIQAESAMTDIFVIVGVLSIISFASLSTSQIFQNLASYLFLSLGIGIITSIVWAFILKHLGHYSSAPIATMAVLVIIYAFAEYVGANGVIAVFFFSIILGNIAEWSKLVYATQKESIGTLSGSTRHFFKDISFLIRTFLFVYLGTLVDFSQWGLLLLGLVFFLVAYMLRSSLNNIKVNRDLTKKENYFLDSMCAKGLTPTVMLAVIGANSRFSNILIGGIFSSALITSIFIFLIEKEKFTSFWDIITHKINWKRYIAMLQKK
ncbi:MAG: cation:proton antiporter [Nanoarchaeota archaeon]